MLTRVTVTSSVGKENKKETLFTSRTLQGEGKKAELTQTEKAFGFFLRQFRLFYQEVFLHELSHASIQDGAPRRRDACFLPKVTCHEDEPHVKGTITRSHPPQVKGPAVRLDQQNRGRAPLPTQRTSFRRKAGVTSVNHIQVSCYHTAECQG